MSNVAQEGHGTDSENQDLIGSDPIWSRNSGLCQEGTNAHFLRSSSRLNK